MTNFTTQLQFHFKRLVLRNPRFAFFDVAVPAGFYLLFTKIMNQGMPANFNQQYMISMTIYATLLSSIITVANNVFADRQQGLIRLLDVTPTSRWSYYVAMGTVFLGLTLIEVALIEGLAAVVVGVRFSLGMWLVILGIVTLTSLPLMLIGVCLAFCDGASLINLLSTLCVFPVAMISGLWWPLAMLPNWLQRVGKLLPTYQSSIIVQRMTNHEFPGIAPILGELIWVLLAGGLVIGCQKIVRNRQM